MDPCSNITHCKRQSSSMTIHLENPLKAYFAGEMVRGTVNFQAQENQTVQILSVYLRGEFYHKRGDEELIERTFTESSPVDYRGAGEGNIELEFSVVLRPNSPTSLVSPLGGIRYRIFSALVFKQDEKMECAECSELISVNCPKQLPENCGERQISSVERAGLICCIGSVAAEMSVSRSLLLCGRVVVVNGCVFNGTHSNVQSTAVSIIQTVERQRDGKKTKRKMASRQKGAVLPGKRQLWLSEAFVIPPLPPTTADPFFKTSYKFVMEIQKDSGKTMKLKIPLVIGNVAHSEETLPVYSYGDPGSQIEWRCSDYPNESDDFKPLYVTYISR